MGANIEWARSMVVKQPLLEKRPIRVVEWKWGVVVSCTYMMTFCDGISDVRSPVAFEVARLHQ